MTATVPHSQGTTGAGVRDAIRPPRDSLARQARAVNPDRFVEEWPEAGMVAMDSLCDPEPSVRVENGVIVEMDGTARADFDFIDQFIADKAIDIECTERSMA